jgi:hypothetical protein
MKLQDWANEHEPSETLVYKSGYWPMICFVRDVIAPLVSTSYEDCKGKVQVLSTHRSKSVLLPVFSFGIPEADFEMRYNFHDWNLSVDSLIEVGDYARWFDDAHGYCFFQGMSKQFGRYAQDARRFSICVTTNYELHAFFFLLNKQFGIVYK